MGSFLAPGLSPPAKSMGPAAGALGLASMRVATGVAVLVCMDGAK